MATWTDLTFITKSRKMIYDYINKLIDNAQWLKDNGGGGGGDMYKATYDTDNDGVVDAAEGVMDGSDFVTGASIADTVAGLPNKVSKTGDETIAGIKTFSSIPVLPASDPTTDNQAARKAYVDSVAGSSLLSILEVDNANYTILDTDGYNCIIFKNLSADRTLYLPTLADNISRRIIIYNLTGTYKVIVTPEGTDKINDYNAAFEITEAGARLDVVGLSIHWEATPSENCCVYEVSTTSQDTGLTLDGTYDDVAGMVLTLPAHGIGKCSMEGLHGGIDTGLPSYIYLYSGLGTLSGDNAPNIRYGNGYSVLIVRAIANTMYSLQFRDFIPEFELEATGQTIYMKARITSDESPCTSHYMVGSATIPIYIRWRRIR